MKASTSQTKNTGLNPTLKIAILLLLVLSLQRAFGENIQTPSPKLPIVFKTQEEINKADLSSIIPETYYFSNAFDDPATIPNVGKKDGINYISIESLKGFPTSKEETISTIDQWIKIPKEKEITITFKTRLLKDPLFQWARTKSGQHQFKKTQNLPAQPTLEVNFQESPGTQYPNNKPFDKINLPLDINQEAKPWQNHSYTLKVPPDAQYLHIKLTTMSGFSIWLGDWKIE